MFFRFVRLVRGEPLLDWRCDVDQTTHSHAQTLSCHSWMVWMVLPVHWQVWFVSVHKGSNLCVPMAARWQQHSLTYFHHHCIFAIAGYFACHYCHQRLGRWNLCRAVPAVTASFHYIAIKHVCPLFWYWTSVSQGVPHRTAVRKTKTAKYMNNFFLPLPEKFCPLFKHFARWESRLPRR